MVNYCIKNEYNYALAAEKYKVSYQQARNYVVKYELGGVNNLHDRRGKRKTEHEMNEIEKLRAEMEVSFLKKLAEIERRRG